MSIFATFAKLDPTIPVWQALSANRSRAAHLRIILGEHREQQGPISNIAIRANRVEITLEWLAERTGNGLPWRAIEYSDRCLYAPLEPLYMIDDHTLRGRLAGNEVIQLLAANHPELFARSVVLRRPPGIDAASAWSTYTSTTTPAWRRPRSTRANQTPS